MFGTKRQFFCLGIAIFCQKSISPICLRLPKKSFHPEKISLSELWVIFGGSPRLLAIWGHSHFRSISTFNSSMKLGGTVRAIKYDNGPGSSRNYRKTAVFTFGWEVFFWPTIVFFPKKHPKFAKRLIFIWEKGTFLFAQLCPVVARTWLELRSKPLFGP